MSECWHILGAGAIGGLCSARLAAAGAEISLICRSESSLQQFAGNALILREQDGSESHWGPPNLRLELPSSTAPIERLLVATKAHQAVPALAAVSQRLTPDSDLLLLVNGMGVAEQIQQRWPGLHLYCGTTTEGAWRPTAGVIQHAGKGTTRIGRWQLGGPAPSWFSHWQNSALQASWEENIEHVLWQKLSINCVINPLSALHDCPNGGLLERPELRRQLPGLCREVERVSQAAGMPTPEEGVLALVESVIRNTARNISSMLQDRRAGQATEIDYINGYFCQQAEQLGIDVPLHRALLAKARSVLQATN